MLVLAPIAHLTVAFSKVDTRNVRFRRSLAWSGYAWPTPTSSSEPTAAAISHRRAQDMSRGGSLLRRSTGGTRERRMGWLFRARTDVKPTECSSLGSIWKSWTVLKRSFTRGILAESPRSAPVDPLHELLLVHLTRCGKHGVEQGEIVGQLFENVRLKTLKNGWEKVNSLQIQYRG